MFSLEVAIGILHGLIKSRRTLSAIHKRRAQRVVSPTIHALSVSAALLALTATRVARAQEAPAQGAPSEEAPPRDPRTDASAHSHHAPEPLLSLDDLGVPAPGTDTSRAVDYNHSSAPKDASNYLWPLVDVAAINLTLWAIPYSLGVPFAQVNPTYWKSNLQTGFQWDDNEFEVNQFAHPYQGGMYFTAARIHGLTFWESVPYTLFGSLTWEYFLETEQPSTNDWLSTTWGGFLFGESLYRLSNWI